MAGRKGTTKRNQFPSHISSHQTEAVSGSSGKGRGKGGDETKCRTLYLHVSLFGDRKPWGGEVCHIVWWRDTSRRWLQYHPSPMVGCLCCGVIHHRELHSRTLPPPSAPLFFGFGGNKQTKTAAKKKMPRPVSRYWWWVIKFLWTSFTCQPATDTRTSAHTAKTHSLIERERVVSHCSSFFDGEQRVEGVGPSPSS